MKRTLYLIGLAILAATLIGASQVRFTGAENALISVSGTSTMHDWKMSGTTIRGAITASESVSTGPLAAEVRIVIPVASIKSEHARMDKLMQEALKAKRHPEITYELASAAIERSDGATFVARTLGKLTIAGTTREIEMQISGRRGEDNAYILKGEVPIRMTDYDVKPPTAMLGTVKTGNDVVVSFQWTVQRAQ